LNDIRYTIGQLARKTGVKITTIRYFEKSGVMPEPLRSAGNTRYYRHEHLTRLAFIKHCRELGFNQAEIRELLSLTEQPELACDGVTRIARNHLQQIIGKIERLTALRAELEQMIDACSGGNVGHCGIIETLADHSHNHCLHDRH
jgi:DNA-binding transcriptional MerR regulator